ncbi:MAG: PD-(D/E)XK nuclease family protein [Methylotenera sp.]
MSAKRYNHGMSLSTSTVTICSTARLVRGVNLQYQQRQLECGIGQWQTTETYTLQQWLDGLIGDAALLGLLPSDALPTLILSSVAEAHLWEQAIATCLEKHEAAALFDIRALSRSAIEANQLMCDWQISEADINQNFISQETRQFLRWRHTFESLCAKQNAIEAARLTALQIALIEKHQLHLSKEVPLPQRVMLAGFDRITPLENCLFEYLKACGVQVEMLAINAANTSHVEYYALSDSHAECRAAVAWAKQKLVENPRVQLAIISPVLGNIRRELADLLDDTFHPETLQPSRCESPRCYDFSLGLALTEYPIVHSALQLLRLASSKANMSFEDVTPILQDVYWSSQAEMDARAQLDAYLRQRLNASYGLETLLKQADKLQADGVQLFALIEHLGMVRQFQNQHQQRQLPSAWVAAFVGLLDALNWANSRGVASKGLFGRSLSSHEYQAQQAFIKGLKELGALDAILGKITANEAVQKIAELCSATMFQAEATGDIHIQILGLLETPAVQLDAVWALNMNDQHWPPPVKLNPLLPAELQRSRGTPNASAGIQSEFASLVQQRLMVSAPEIVFSYAIKEDERELRPSPLLSINPSATPLKQPDIIQTLAENMAQPAAMQMVDDFMAPAVLPDEKVRGGVKLFSTQAICPAWAFYQYRLGANKLETPIDGLDNMSRGSLLHKVLQYFWQDCGNLSNLKAMDGEQRVTAIDAVIEKSMQALKDEIGHNEVSFNLPPQVMLIEQHRLQQLMQFWLDLELERADFEVQACEQKHTLEVEGLPLNLTIDRIDTLADGGIVVIDYKTGSMVANKSWADDRIAEPQLPIYAALALKDEQVLAVCFAKIRTDETKFIGLSAEEGVLPEVTALAKVRANSAFKRFDNWDALLQHWHTSLTTIAQEIKSGVAGVIFNNESDLDYCDVKPLLRLPERRMQFERMQATLKSGDE